MNDSIQFLNDFQDKVKSSKNLIIGCVTICCVCIIAMTILISKVYTNSREQIYVLDNGSVLQALRGTNDVQRDLEAINHVSRFHELFFNMAPNQESINASTDKALLLADRSAYNYYSDLKEQQYYTRLIQANATQQIIVDSVHIDVNSYPYKAHTFATIYLIRESNITKYDFESTCQLSDVTRTTNNPHGLQIERFAVNRYEQGETRRRN